MTDRTTTIFMLLGATAKWRALDFEARAAVFDDALATVFNGYPGLRMTRFRSDALGGRCSDVIVWDATDLAQYDAAIAALRVRPLLGDALFEIVEVIPGIEDDGGDTARAPFDALALAALAA